MVPVVEQADVPAAAQLFQELGQRAGPLRKFKAAEPFVLHVRRASADHVADVQLRHLVVGEVHGLVAGARSCAARRAPSWRDCVEMPTKMWARSRPLKR
jgi:hypothetical protein